MTVDSDQLVALRESTPERIWRFCEALLADTDCDVKAAAIVAGAPGQARDLMSDRRTLVLLGAMRGELRATNASLRHELVAMLARMATMDPGDAMLRGGEIKDVLDMPQEVRMCIESIEITPAGGVKVRFSKRLDAIKLLFTLFGDLDAPQVAGGTARVVFRGRGSV